jgi:hypothetical protein
MVTTSSSEWLVEGGISMWTKVWRLPLAYLALVLRRGERLMSVGLVGIGVSVPERGGEPGREGIGEHAVSVLAIRLQ